MDIPYDLLVNAIVAGLLLGGFYVAVQWLRGLFS